MIKNQLNKAWYAFGSNDTKDGIFCVDFDNVNESTIEKSSKSVSDVWALRAISHIIIEKIKGFQLHLHIVTEDD